MGLKRIEDLLDAYFEGETTVQQEQELRDYFSGADIAPHLELYVPMFNAFVSAQGEKFTGTIDLPQEKRRLYWIPVAASIAVIIGAFAFFGGSLNNNNDYGTYQDADVAALKAKQAIVMMSNFMNKGTDQLKVIDEFSKTTKEYVK